MEAILTARKPSMGAKLSLHLPNMEAIEQLVVATIANFTGILVLPTRVQLAGYQAFAKQCYAAQQHYGGGSVLITLFESLAVKWATRGLAIEALGRILTDIFHYDCVPLGAFNKLTPVNHAIDVALEKTLTWAASANATHYEVYYGVAQSPNSPTAIVTGATAWTTPTKTYATQYFWQIIARKLWNSLPATGGTFDFVTRVAP